MNEPNGWEWDNSEVDLYFRISSCEWTQSYVIISSCDTVEIDFHNESEYHYYELEVCIVLL